MKLILIYQSFFKLEGKAFRLKHKVICFISENCDWSFFPLGFILHHAASKILKNMFRTNVVMQDHSSGRCDLGCGYASKRVRENLSYREAPASKTLPCTYMCLHLYDYQILPNCIWNSKSEDIPPWPMAIVRIHFEEWVHAMLFKIHLDMQWS